MNIAVLVSNKGTGSNLLAILEDGFQVKIVIADSQDAPGIKIAKDKRIAYKVLPYLRPKDLEITEYRNQYSKEIGKILRENKIDIAILAGFNRILTKPYFKIFSGITINIHPGAIAEMCFGGDCGVELAIDLQQRPDSFLFNETAGVFVIEVENPEKARELFESVPHMILGKTTADRNFVVHSNGQELFTANIDELKEAWQEPMRRLFH